MRTSYRHTIVACYFGYITQAIVNNFAPLLFLIFQDTYAIPLEKITLLITFNFCVQLLVDFVAARYVERIGYRVSIVIAHVCAAVGLVGLAVFPEVFPTPYMGLLVAAIIYAIGGGIIEVLISPIVEACPNEHKSAAMSLLHSFYCWGTVAVILGSVAGMTLFGKDCWRVLACVWAVIPALNALYFTQVPIRMLTEPEEGMTGKELVSQRLFWLLVVLMVAAGASEQAMIQWTSAFAEAGLGISKSLGDLAGPCAFAVLMGCARACYAVFSERVPLLPALTGSGILCILSYLLAALSPVPALALLGCALCGLSVGILWPGVFSLAAEACPKGGTVMFAFLALAGDLGCGGGPTVVGLVAGLAGDELRVGLLAAIAFPVLLIAGVSLLRRMHKKS